MSTLSSEDKRIRGSKGQKLRRQRLSRSNYLCEHCLARGVTRLAKVVNHKIPLAHGGQDVDENTENLCAECDEVETKRLFGGVVKRPIALDGWPLED